MRGSCSSRVGVGFSLDGNNLRSLPTPEASGIPHAWQDDQRLKDRVGAFVEEFHADLNAGGIPPQVRQEDSRLPPERERISSELDDVIYGLLEDSPQSRSVWRSSELTSRGSCTGSWAP